MSEPKLRHDGDMVLPMINGSAEIEHFDLGEDEHSDLATGHGVPCFSN
jgi:hypothetical protein